MERDNFWIATKQVFITVMFFLFGAVAGLVREAKQCFS